MESTQKITVTLMTNATILWYKISVSFHRSIDPSEASIGLGSVRSAPVKVNPSIASSGLARLLSMTGSSAEITESQLCSLRPDRGALWARTLLLRRPTDPRTHTATSPSAPQRSDTNIK